MSTMADKADPRGSVSPYMDIYEWSNNQVQPPSAPVPPIGRPLYPSPPSHLPQPSDEEDMYVEPSPAPEPANGRPLYPAPSAPVAPIDRPLYPTPPSHLPQSSDDDGEYMYAYANMSHLAQKPQTDEKQETEGYEILGDREAHKAEGDNKQSGYEYVSIRGVSDDIAGHGVTDIAADEYTYIDGQVRAGSTVTSPEPTDNNHINGHSLNVDNTKSAPQTGGEGTGSVDPGKSCAGKSCGGKSCGGKGCSPPGRPTCWTIITLSALLVIGGIITASVLLTQPPSSMKGERLSTMEPLNRPSYSGESASTVEPLNRPSYSKGRLLLRLEVPPSSIRPAVHAVDDLCWFNKETLIMVRAAKKQVLASTIHHDKLHNLDKYPNLKSPENADNPENPYGSETPYNPETPYGSETPYNPETPYGSDTPDNIEDPDKPENPGNQNVTTVTLDSGYEAWRVSCRRDHEIYVVDRTSQQILIYRQGNKTSWKPNQMRLLDTIAVNDNRIVVGEATGYIYIFKINRDFVRKVKLQNQQLLSYTSLTQDDLFLASTGVKGHRLIIFQRGELQVVVGGEGRGEGQLLNPTGVAGIRKGDILVASRNTHRISVFSRAGEFRWYLVLEDDQVSPLQNPRPISVYDGRRAKLLAVAQRNIVRIYLLLP